MTLELETHIALNKLRLIVQLSKNPDDQAKDSASQGNRTDADKENAEQKRRYVESYLGSVASRVGFIDARNKKGAT